MLKQKIIGLAKSQRFWTLAASLGYMIFGLENVPPEAELAGALVLIVTFIGSLAYREPRTQ